MSTSTPAELPAEPLPLRLVLTATHCAQQAEFTLTNPTGDPGPVTGWVMPCVPCGTRILCAVQRAELT